MLHLNKYSVSNALLARHSREGLFNRKNEIWESVKMIHKMNHAAHAAEIIRMNHLKSILIKISLAAD